MTTTTSSSWTDRISGLFDGSGKSQKKNTERKKEQKAERRQRRKTRTDARRIDYRYAEDDPFFFIKGDSVWTGVILGTTSDDYTSGLEDLQQVSRHSEMYKSLSSHFANHHQKNDVRFHLITRYVPVDVSRWESQYLAHCWDPSQLFLDLVKSKISPHLAESSPERRQYLLIRLGDFDAPVEVDPISKILGESAAVQEEVFNSRDLRPFREMAMSVHSLLSSMGAVPMDRVDLAWLIRKALRGHFPADNGLSVERTRPWRGGFFDEIVNADMTAMGDFVRIRNPDPSNGLGEYSYTTTVTLNYQSPLVSYEYNNAWGKKLRTFPRPVDVSWRGTVLSAEEWRKRAKKSIRDIEDEDKERRSVHAPHSEAFETKMDMADVLKNEHEEQAQPVLVSQQRLTFSAPTPEELTDVTTKLQAMFGDDIEVVRTSGAQGFLLEEQLPGDMTAPKTRFAGLGRMVLSDLTGALAGDDERWTDLEALAFARLDSSPAVGDEIEYAPNGSVLGWRGGPIGYTLLNGAVVHFDPTVQMNRNRGAGVIIIGSSGGGKSSLSLMLFFWSSESGVQCIAIDPKNDFQRFVYYLSFGNQVNHPDFFNEARRGTLGLAESQFQPTNPTFWEDSSVVNLGDGAPGMLDPWAITGGDYGEGEQVAREILDLVFSKSDMKILDRALQRMSDYYEGREDLTPALANLINFTDAEMSKYEEYITEESTGTERLSVDESIAEIRSVHHALERAATRGYGKLMFGKSSGAEPFSLGKKRRVVITLFGLQLPDENTPVEEWDESTRDGAAAMLTVIKQLKTMFSRNQESFSQWQNRRALAPRLLFIDEAYFVTAFKAGRSMLSQFLRQGRSLSFGVVFISQQAKDVNMLNEDSSDEEASTNQFPTKFVFRQGGLSEARDALHLLKANSSQLDEREEADLAKQLLNPNDGGQMYTGRCVMSDVDGRISTVQVDRMLDEITWAAETNPGTRAEAQMHTPSPNGAQWTVDTSLRDSVRTGVIVTEVGEIKETIDRYEYDEYEALLSDAQ